MANEIRLKRGSGSDPGASDLVTGEIAVRTDTGKLFTKKDDGSVAEISGGGIDDGDKGDITVSNSGGTFTIDSGVIDNANVASNAAITGSKINPSFGNQAVISTNSIKLDGSVGDTIIKASGAEIEFTRGASSNITCSDSSGSLNINTAGSTRMTIASDGTTTVAQNLDVGAGLDVTGNIIASGDITANGGDMTISGTSPILHLVDTNDNPNYRVQNVNGVFQIYDATSDASRLNVNTDGHVDVVGNLDVGSGLDVTGNISVSGTVDGRDLATDGTKLDGIASGATNVTNTNQLTNGAGFITATLTNEQVQDIVGGMVTGNTETGITVTYQDGDGTLDFVVGTLNQDTTGNAATATKLATARTIAGVSFDGSANISLNNNAITNGAGYITGSSLNASNLSSGTIPDARFPATLPAISGANLTNISATVLSDSNSNTVGGTNAGDSITSGDNNTFFGKDAGTDITDAQFNTFIGSLAGSNTNSGTYLNTFVGYNAGINNGNGHQNVFIGANTGINNANWSNVFIGNDSGDANTSGTENVFVGRGSGGSNTTGSYNTCLGKDAGKALTTSSYGVFIGYEAGKTYSDENQFGASAICIGAESGENATGVKNTIIGTKAGQSIGSAANCVIIGNETAKNRTGNYNVAIGMSALPQAGDGTNTVAIGFYSGGALTSGDDCVFLGHQAGDNGTTGDNNICIGSGSDLSAADVSNEITLGDGNINKFRIPGLLFEIGADGINIGANDSSNPFDFLRFGGSQFGAADIAPHNAGSHTIGLSFRTDSTADTTINPTEAMRISANGNIGAPNGSNIYSASDSRLKQNVTTLDKGLSAINSLRPVSFNWVDGFCDEEKDTLYGFIAQEVQTIDSNLISQFAPNRSITIGETTIEDALTVNEKFIIPMLVKAVQELTARITTLESS